MGGTFEKCKARLPSLLGIDRYVFRRRLPRFPQRIQHLIRIYCRYYSSEDDDEHVRIQRAKGTGRALVGVDA